MKICALTRIDDVKAANALHQEMVRFVFHKPGQRYVSREVTRYISSLADPSISK